ncbi:MAG: T9SS type A sorting domain-containing protein [Chlorobi bacterium]|nr:T9SS type A sorting domain-containing protein [Chlorobiota bacterium]
MKTYTIRKITILIICFIVTNKMIGQINFIKYNNGVAPVLEKSTNLTDWDFTVAADAEVVFYKDTFRLWYTSAGIPPQYSYPRIGYAWSLDGVSWTKHGSPVFEGTSGDWDSLAVETVSVLVDTMAPLSERYKMWYVGTNDPNQILYHNMGYAFSPDGINWAKSSSNPVLSAKTTSTGIDVLGFEGPSIVFDGSTYHMWYSCIPIYNNLQYWDGWINIAYASSSDGINWIKKTDEPAFKISQNGWDSLFVQTPDVIKIGDTFHMFYTGTASDSTYQTAGGGWHYSVGYAWALDTDIHNWTRYATPVLEKGIPGSWDDASVGLVSIEYINNNLYMWYTGQDSCINDTNCVWPTIPYWDTGLAIDSSITLSVNGFLFQNCSEITIYPNPMTESSTLEFENPKQKDYTLSIFNAQGKLVLKIRNIQTNKVIIKKNNLSPGMYYCQVSTSREVYATVKLIIQ